MSEFVRKRPTAINKRNVLTAETREGFHRRFVNDIDDEIKYAMDCGYTPVLDADADNTAPKVGRPSKLGNLVRKSVRGGMHAVLMEIPMEWYLENQAEKAEKRREQEKMMEPAQGQYGSIEISRK